MKSNRGVLIDKAFKTVALLSTKPHTAKELAEKLECGLKSAYRYIDSASLFLRVTEQKRDCLNRPMEFWILA